MTIPSFLSKYLAETWSLTSEMAPYLLLGFSLAGLLRVFFNEEFVRRHLGQRGLRQILKAVIIGIPLPLCSCGVIPVAAGIRRQGGQRGAVAAFTASTPQTGVDSIIATVGMLGWVFTGVRVAIAFVNGIVAGFVVEWLDGRTRPAETDSPSGSKGCCSHDPEQKSCCSDEPAQKSCCSHEPVKKDCCSHEPEQKSCCSHEPDGPAPSGQGSGFLPKLKSGLEFGLVTLPRDLFGALVVGLLLAGAISAFAPDDLFSGMPGGLFGIYLGMTLISLPLYVCSTGSIPMALAFLHAGMSPGAVLIFLIAGPASNTATVTALWRIIGGKATIGYILSIIGTCWVVAVLIDFSGISLLVTEAAHAHEMGVNLFQQVMAGLLVAVLLFSRFSGRRPAMSH